MSLQGPYYFGKKVKQSFPDLLERTRKALQEQGFGILTEIDVQGKIKEKLGEDFRSYVILGACNPSLAHKALSQELPLGVLLPCNVVVYEEKPGECAVVAMDPVGAMQMVEAPGVSAIASEVKGRLSKALDSL